jgi:signal transduction histidine kinase
MRALIIFQLVFPFRNVPNLLFVPRGQFNAERVSQQLINVVAGIILLMLVTLVYFLIRSRKRISIQNQQLQKSNAELFSKNDEISAQNRQILLQQAQLSAAFENAKLLRDIGQAVTKSLSIEDIVVEAYQHVSHLMDASVFGMGIINQQQAKLEFPKVIKKGIALPYFMVDLTESNRFDTWCVRNKKSVLINDLHYDYHRSIKGEQSELLNASEPTSLICAPIVQQSDVIGLIYVQTERPDAFTEYHLSLIQNICIYVSNALVNAKNHRTIIEKNEMLDRHNTVKDKLLSVIGHDLRGPMNSLRGFLPLLKTKSVSDMEREFLISRLEENFTYTQQLLDNVLQWANAKISGVAMMKKSFDLQVIAIQTMNVLREIYAAKEITVENRIESTMVFGDANTIQIVIRNLISNAIKFTSRRGKITISSETLNDLVKVSVTDTGVGIPEEIRLKLFQVSLRHTTYGTDMEKGTGLGLHLCKEFVDINGGDIGVESEIGNGSRFWFTIPLHARSLPEGVRLPSFH